MNPLETILIVEDDTSLAEGLSHNLRFDGYQVLVARDGVEGLRIACDELPDLMILDLGLPRLSGFDVLSAVRAEQLEMQVIILSARGLEEDKVQGLLLGADDYMTKPFGLRELLARIDSALRRPRLSRQTQIELPMTFGNVEIFSDSREVRLHGEPIHLTAREFDLLLYLVSNPDRPHGREHLLRKIWGYNYEGTARTVDNFIRKLRRKLEPDPTAPLYFKTVHGVGYCFEFQIVD